MKIIRLHLMTDALDREGVEEIEIVLKALDTPDGWCIFLRCGVWVVRKYTIVKPHPASLFRHKICISVDILNKTAPGWKRSFLCVINYSQGQ